MNLNDVLNDEVTRASIIEDVCRLVDDEVASNAASAVSPSRRATSWSKA